MNRWYGLSCHFFLSSYYQNHFSQKVMTLSIMSDLFPTVFDLGFPVFIPCVLMNSFLFFFFFKWHIFKTIHANTYIALSTSDVPVASLHKHDLTLLSSVLLRRKLQPISPLICQLGAAGNLSAPLLQMDILLLRAIPQQFVRTQPWQNDCVISNQGVIFLTAIFFEDFWGFILQLLQVLAGSLQQSPTLERNKSLKGNSHVPKSSRDIS